MRFQIFLSLTALVLPILSLPLQYTEATDLEARFGSGDNEVFSRTYFDLDEREFDEPRLVVRSPQHNDHNHAVHATANTHNKPAHTHQYTMPNGDKSLTGAHVHQAIYDFHRHDPIPTGAHHGSAQTSGGGHMPHRFNNNPNHSDGLKPFPHLPSGPGANLHEFPIKQNGFNGGKPGAGRIIMHHDPATQAYSFVGVVGHPKKGSQHPGDLIRAT